jgi:hypothetical protein
MCRTRDNLTMSRTDADLLAQLPLSEIDKVTFYKRDEITSDLICCEIVIAGTAWTFHEELDGWGLLIAHLQSLPSFRGDWFAAVSQPPFAASETVAFSRF